MFPETFRAFFRLEAAGGLLLLIAAKYAGDTNTNYDPTGYIQVVMEGNFEKTKPTSAQLSSLETLLVEQAKKWRVTADEILVHKGVAATLCPGRHFISIFPDLQARIAARLK